MRRASIYSIVFPFSLATAFSPRNGLEQRIIGVKQDTKTVPSETSHAEVSRLPATMSPSPRLSTAISDDDWMSKNTTKFLPTTRANALSANSKQGKYFLNLPIDKDTELLADQKILAAILKEPIFEVMSVFLVIVSSVLVALSTMNSIDLKTVAMIIRAENVIACIFAFEFFARWYCQFTWKGILDYMLQPLVLIDLVVVILPLVLLMVPPASAEVYDVLPSWLFSSSGLVNLKLLRVLRLQRVLTNMDTFADFQAALGIPRTEVKPYKLELARVVLSIFMLLSISTGLIYSAENTVNPDIPSYFDALYFTLTTLTTVGFGDITPQTPEGKLVVSGSILAGVAVIPAQAGALVEALLEREEDRTGDSRRQRRKQKSKSGDESKSMTMDMISCHNCDARYHWAHANYCWSCGSPLDDR